MKLSAPKYPTVGVYVTMFPATVVVPCAVGVTIAILDDKPVICAVRLIGIVVLNSTVIALSATVGGGGATIVRVTIAAVDVPPGPVAVYVNVSLPK